MTILGIDPGIANCGWALVERTKNKHRNKYKLLDHGCTKTLPKTEEGIRLYEIKLDLDLLIDKCTGICTEKVFFSRNVTSAMSTAKVIGTAQIIAARHNLPFFEVRPNQIKESIGCDRTADKKQMIKRVNKMFKTELKNQHTVDAIAIAITAIKMIEEQDA